MKKIYTLLIVLACISFGFGQTTVTYDFSNGGAVSGLDEPSPGIALDSNIGFGSFKNSGTSNPGIFSSQLRLYQNATKGGSIIIYASNGVTITDITVNASGTTGPAGYTVDGGTATNLSASSTYTISGISATSEVEFYQRNSSSSNRIYVDSFEVTYTSGASCTAPFQASSFMVSTVNTTDAILDITRGGGNDILVVMKEGSAVDTDPTSGTTYTANSIFGGIGASEIGTGNFVVFNGNDGTSNPGIGGANLSVPVSGLTPNTTYHLAFYEYNTVGTCYQLDELSESFTTDPVTTVQFTGTSTSVAEDVGTYDLVIEIANEDAAATTFDVVLTSGDAADIDSYTTQSESFPGSSTTNITVTITVTDDAIQESNEVFSFEIQNVAGGNSAMVGTNNTFDLTILANDAPVIPGLLYDADFSNDGDGFPAHTTSSPPASAPASAGPFGTAPNSWSLSYNSTLSTDGTDNIFEVVSGELLADDWGGQGIFTSQIIDVSDTSTIDISATGINIDANENTFTYFYILDGGSRVETPIFSSDGDPVNYSIIGLDVSGATNLEVGFEFSENGGGQGYSVSEFMVNEGASETSVQFSTTSTTVSEDVGTYDLIIEITNEDAAATTFDVVLTSGDAADIDSYTTQSESFPGGSATNVTVTVTITDDALLEGDETLTFEIQNVAGGDNAAVGLNNTFDLTILSSDLPTPEEAIAGDLIITEVSGDDADFNSSNDNGYMEIYNRSNKVINLDNIEARYFNSNPGNSTQQVTLSGSLVPGGYIIVSQDAANYASEYSDAADATGSQFFFNGGDDGCDVFHTSNGVIDQFNDNGSGQSPWNWSDGFIYNRNSSDSGAIENNWTQSSTNSPRSKTNLYFWTGNSDSSWNNVGNWDEGSVPASMTDVVITDQTNKPLITSSVQVSHFTIESSTDVIVEKTGSLEASGNLNNNGNLTLESDSDEYSSFIAQGTVTGTGTTAYNRYVNSNDPINGNDLISAPVSGQAFDIFIANNPNIRANPTGPEVLFGGFDNDSSTDPFELWDETDTTLLVAGKGYRSGITEGEASNLVTFEGIVNSSLVEIAIDQGSASKLNLIGNPFPSYLNAQLFLSQNFALLDPSAAVIYGYNDSTDGTSAGDYTIISALLNTDLNIAPGQAFFVASNTIGGNIQFTTTSPDMRLAAGGDDFIAGRNASVISNLKLNLSNTTDNFITDIFFTENSSQGLDPGYDASLLGGAAPSFALYSHLVQDNTGVPFAVQALSKTDYIDVTIPLGVNANQSEQLTFSISESNLPSSVEVYLDDTVANTSTLLNTGDYILTPNTDLNGTGRFYLRFTENTLSTLNPDLDHLNIYSNKSAKTIVIAGQLLESTTAKLYDIQGRLVQTTLLDTTRLQTIDVSNLNAGIYIVQLENGLQNKTQKVIIY
ncbi:Calx-beta domain-containing protein [Winogradskyella forsetii]|uniref:Calx-beta domain-containing protein n=1 Tax=Winogradskyella forsetii TaxID=2686077 RepID=UPI0015BF0D91|nr:T9SS type A sorting domain-containing protein [Winogradskyella forsetii]